MNKDNLIRLEFEKRIRSRSVDKERIKSIIESSKNNADVVLSIKLNDKSATVIFRELYESIRQLGDALWWLNGYEPLDHDMSLEILKEIQIKNTVKLNFLDRFKKIRHDANYRGFKVTESQASEIISFWNECVPDMLNHLKSKLF